MDQPLRRIIHVDMDAFYTSIEQRDNPALRGLAIVVGGDPQRRGVVAAASYEARRFGVHSAMPASVAQRRCPQLIFLPPRFQHYRKVSQALHEIFARYTELVEPIALDEAYLDVTENHRQIPYASLIATELKRTIKAELGLTASAGVGPSKFIAKIASDLRKPDGLVVVPPEHVRAFLSPLPIERLWGVGPATAPKIRELGVSTIGELADVPLELLVRRFGKLGHFLHQLAHGRDPRQVTPDRPAKSRSAERTFDQDLSDPREMARVIGELSHDVSRGLHKMERPGRTIVLKVRYADFTTVTRSRSLGHFTMDAEEISACVAGLLAETDAETQRVRLLGVGVQGLRDLEDPLQLELPFPDTD